MVKQYVHKYYIGVPDSNMLRALVKEYLVNATITHGTGITKQWGDEPCVIIEAISETAIVSDTFIQVVKTRFEQESVYYTQSVITGGLR